MLKLLGMYWMIYWVIYQLKYANAKELDPAVSFLTFQHQPPSTLSSYVENCPNNVNVTLKNTRGIQKAILGLACISINKNVGYQAFRGIPYAQPPVGDLRFRDPVRMTLDDLSDPFDATAYNNDCISTIFYALTNPGSTVGDEDCLHLNIFRPTTRKSKLPVLVWIHGGAFIYQTGNIPVTNSEGFMEKQVIVVTINYRLGVFGFLCTEDDASPGNYGLKDQIAALQWVQDNIASFGGDPNQVTLIGESAGAVSIMYLIQSPKAAGLFQRAIVQSGTTLCPWALSPDPVGIAKEVGLALGLTGLFRPKKLVDALRKVDSVKLSRRASYTLYNAGSNGLPWAPCIDNDTVPGPSYEALENGIFNKVPVLIGFASQEARDFSKISANLISTLKTEFSTFPEKFVLKNMNLHGKIERNVGEQILYEYEVKGSKSIEPFVNYISDNLFIRPMNRTVQFLSQHVPVYFYEFAYTGGSDYSAYHPEAPGACHGEDIQFIFNHFQDPNSDRYKDSVFISEFMLTLWTNFVKQSDPTPSPVNKINWKQAAKEGLQNLAYLYIDVEPKLLYGPRGKTMTFWNDLYNKYKNGSRTTY